jgi:sugar phosphate isomerase/epimerase
MAQSPLSLAFYTVSELDPVAAIEAAAASGCQHAGLRLLNGQPGGSESAIMTDAATRRAVIRRFRECEITPLDANTARIVPQTDIAAFRPFMDVAAECGARHVLATGNDPVPARLAANFAALALLAGEHGLTVEIEFVPWMTIANVLDARRLIEEIGAPNIGIAVDALHFQRSETSLVDIANAPPHYFRYMHLCDAPGGWTQDTDSLLHTAVHERLSPGEGAIDLIGLMRALPLGIPIALEVPMTTLAKTLPARDRAIRVADAARHVLARAFPD